MTRRTVASFALVFATILMGSAAAQTRSLRIVQDAESIEFGGDIGVYNLMGWSFAGGHVTRNYTSWLAGELSLHGARKDGEANVPAPGNAIFVAAARFQGRVDRGRIAFATVGIARAFGLSYRHSPVLGLGMQSAVKSGDVGWRIDFQRFTRGQDLYGGGRLMGGIVIVM